MTRGALLLAAAAIAGCGSNTTTVIERLGPPVTKTQTQTQTTVRGPSGKCEIYLSGHDARIFFSGVAAQALCQQFISQRATQGELWTTSYEAPQGPLGIVCSLESPQGQTGIVVQDDGGQVYGQTACEIWLASHYTESYGNE